MNVLYYDIVLICSICTDASGCKFRISKLWHLLWKERKDYGGIYITLVNKIVEGFYLANQ